MTAKEMLHLPSDFWEALLPRSSLHAYERSIVSGKELLEGPQ